MYVSSDSKAGENMAKILPREAQDWIMNTLAYSPEPLDEADCGLGPTLLAPGQYLSVVDETL